MNIVHYNFIIPLIVIIPLISAVLLLFIKNTLFSWITTFLTTFIVLCITTFILIQGNLTTVGYNFGNFIPPFGIEYEINPVTIFFLFLISIIGFLTSLWSKGNIVSVIGSENTHIFSSIFLLAFSGYLGIVVTNDLFNLFVFLEISSLATYILIAMGSNKNSALAAFDSLIVGTISASSYIFGVGILYLIYGTVNATDLLVKIHDTTTTPAVILAIIMISIGIFIKIALFPVFWWLPQTYQSAPSALSAFLAGISVNVAIYMFIKVIMIVIAQGINLGLHNYFEILIILSFFSIIIGGILAAKENNLKLLLAFSSISHIGVIVIGLALQNKEAIAATLYLTIVHAFLKSALFLCVGNLIYIFGKVNLSDLKGVGAKAPFTFFSIVFLSLSLAGIPGTSLFWGKLSMLFSVLSAQNIIGIMAVILSSILSFIYSWKIIANLWIKNEDGNTADIIHKKVPLYMNTAIFSFILLNIYLTIFPDMAFAFIEKIVNLSIITTG